MSLGTLFQSIGLSALALLPGIALPRGVSAAEQEAEGPAVTVYSTADPAGFDPQRFIAQQRRGYNPTSAWEVPGVGIVKEIRTVQMAPGVNDLPFTDVAQFIDATTVSFTALTDPTGTIVLEQNFQFEKGTEIEFDGPRTIATAPNGARLLLIPFVESMQPTLSLGDESPHTTYWPNGKPRSNTAFKAGKTSVPHGRGWTGRGGNKLLPAPAVTYVGEVELPAVLTMALVPFAPGEDIEGVPEVTSEVEGQGTVWMLPADGGVLRMVSALDSVSGAE